MENFIPGEMVKLRTGRECEKAWTLLQLSDVWTPGEALPEAEGSGQRGSSVRGVHVKKRLGLLGPAPPSSPKGCQGT